MRECTASSSSPSTSVGAYATLYRLHPSRCGLPFDIARCRPPSRTTHLLVSAFHHYCVGTPHTPPWEWNRSLSSMTFSSPKPVARAYQNLKAEVSTKRRVASILLRRQKSVGKPGEPPMRHNLQASGAITAAHDHMRPHA